VSTSFSCNCLDQDVACLGVEFLPASELYISGEEAVCLPGPSGLFQPETFHPLPTQSTYAHANRCRVSSLAWAEMYMVIAALAQRFDFQFEGAKAEDFECSSDQFIIGTSGKGVIKTTASLVSSE